LSDNYKIDVNNMTPEEKKAAEEAAAKAQAEAEEAEFQTTLEGLSDEEKAQKLAEREASKDTDKNIDYKAQAEKEREARKKAEETIIKNKIHAKKEKKPVEDEDDPEDDEDEDQPITRREFSRVIEENTRATERRLLQPQIANIARDLADSEDEAEAIVETHRNRSFPSHLSLKEQMEECHAIVNRARLVSKNKELVRSLQHKKTVNTDPSSSHRDPQAGSAPKMSDSDSASYARAGFSFDPTLKLFKKKLPNGKFLFKDPKTKATYIK
jgi:hypothetical protein